MFGCFFFFQAEDGIRDHCVTGVQTCALPISRERVARALDVVDRQPALDPAALLLGPGPKRELLARERASAGRRDEIGRASCRERGESSVGTGASNEEERRTVSAARCLRAGAG